MELINLDDYDNLESLRHLYNELSPKNVTFTGRTFYNAKTDKAIDISQLVTKIESIYQTMPKEVDTAKEMMKIIVGLRRLAEETADPQNKYMVTHFFGKGGHFQNITDKCKETVRKSHAVMEEIVKKYNQSAKAVNKQIGMGNKPSERDLEHLENFNAFLGVKWAREQQLGNEFIPLCHTLSINPNSSIYQLVEVMQLFNKDTPGRDIREVSKRLVALYNNEMRDEPYVKSDIYIQILMAVNTLKSRCPHYKKFMSPKLHEIYKIALENLKEDKKVVDLFRTEYNKMATELNSRLVCLLENQQQGDEHFNRENTVEKLKLFNLLAKMSLNDSHFMGFSLIPLHYDLTQPNDRYKCKEDYNLYAMTLNYEQMIGQVHNRYDQISRQLSSQSSFMLDKHAKDQLMAELHRLENIKENLSPPLPSIPDLHDSIRSELDRLAKLLNLSFTIEQKRGEAPFPIFGRDVHSRQEIISPLQLPSVAEWYNVQSSWITHYHTLRRKLNELSLLLSDLSTSSEKDTHLQYEQAVRYEEKKKECDTERSLTHIHNERNYNRFLKFVYLTNDYLRIQLTEKQKNGQEDWPTIEIENLPVPDQEEFEKYLRLYGSIKLLETAEKWPASWKLAFQEQLKSLPPLPPRHYY